MTQHIDIDKVAAHNPDVDEQKLRQSMDIVSKLRAAGIKDTSYALSPPFARKTRPPQSEPAKAAQKR